MRASTTTLDRTLAALAHPVRREILDALMGGSRSVTELAEPFDMTVPAVSMHIATLEKAGLVARGRDAQWRPCRLDAAPMRAVVDWLEGYRRFWDESLDRLEAYARTLDNPTLDNPDSRQSGLSELSTMRETS